MDMEVMKLAAVGLIGTFGFLGPAFALGIIGYATLTGIARNPEAGDRLFTTMILIAGLAEALGIYALILGIILAMII
ncbi:ATP synthase subunit c [subsurface metagenome]